MSGSWRERCDGKLTSLKHAVALIRRGEHIFLSDGSATPLGILPGLVADDAPLGDNVITHLLTLGEAPYVKPEYVGRFRHNALFIGPNVRQAIQDGHADYTPVFLSEIPRLIRARRIPIDVAIVSVTTPDAEGNVSVGTHNSLAPAAIEVSRIVIGQVNPRMPRTHGPTRVPVSRFAALVEAEHPLPELRPPVDRAETASIAAHIAGLVPDGATLQLGIGGIPDMVLRHLIDRNDLGIHTEMFSDGVVELVKRGVITGKRKTLNPGKIIAAFTMGTQKLYDFLDDNDMVHLHPVDYTNDPFIIAQNDNMIAINTALEIDLTGQVCADSIGTRFYSGIGGQVDFIRGASRSRGGKPIIALPSTASNGTISRIVPRMDDGAGVVTTRGDVHYVVTEYGVADLHGRNVRERAMALISIAHPKFRPWLLAEAKQRRFVYSDQIEPPLHVPLYPRELEEEFSTKKGLTLFCRPIKPTDESLLHDMFYRFSQETIYQRFFAVKKFMPHPSLQRFCTIDYDVDMTLVAVARSSPVDQSRAVPGPVHDHEIICGMGLYAYDADSETAEVACVVADTYQNQGIGSFLVRRLTKLALERRLKGFTAQVLAGNVPMLRVFDKCGFPVSSTRDGDTVSLTIPFVQKV